MPITLSPTTSLILAKRRFLLVEGEGGEKGGEGKGEGEKKGEEKEKKRVEKKRRIDRKMTEKICREISCFAKFGRRPALSRQGLPAAHGRIFVENY